MRAFSFTQPRFDSTATPMMKFCLLVRAIAFVPCKPSMCPACKEPCNPKSPKLLSFLIMGYKERNKPGVRHRAELALQRVQGPSLFRCALTCDYMYTSECLRFLRVFDKEDPDAAKIPEILDNFCARLKLLRGRLHPCGYMLCRSIRSPRPQVQHISADCAD